MSKLIGSKTNWVKLDEGFWFHKNKFLSIFLRSTESNQYMSGLVSQDGNMVHAKDFAIPELAQRFADDLMEALE